MCLRSNSIHRILNFGDFHAELSHQLYLTCKSLNSTRYSVCENLNSIIWQYELFADVNRTVSWSSSRRLCGTHLVQHRTLTVNLITTMWSAAFRCRLYKFCSPAKMILDWFGCGEGAFAAQPKRIPIIYLRNFSHAQNSISNRRFEWIILPRSIA